MPLPPVLPRRSVSPRSPSQSGAFPDLWDRSPCPVLCRTCFPVCQHPLWSRVLEWLQARDRDRRAALGPGEPGSKAGWAQVGTPCGQERRQPVSHSACHHSPGCSGLTHPSSSAPARHDARSALAVVHVGRLS